MLPYLGYAADSPCVGEERSVLVPIVIDEAEAPILLEHIGNHVPVPLLEDMQRHHRTWEQDDGEREEG